MAQIIDSVIGKLSIGFVWRRWCHDFAPPGFRRRNVATVAVDRWSVPQRIVDHVRLRKSTWRGGVDMEAIVSAICAHAGHELCACFLSNSRFRCWATRRRWHGRRAARKRPRSPVSIAIRSTERSPGGSRGAPDPFLQKSSRFVAGVIQGERCRLCKIAQIDTAWVR